MIIGKSGSRRMPEVGGSDKRKDKAVSPNTIDNYPEARIKFDLALENLKSKIRSIGNNTKMLTNPKNIKEAAVEIKNKAAFLVLLALYFGTQGITNDMENGMQGAEVYRKNVELHQDVMYEIVKATTSEDIADKHYPKRNPNHRQIIDNANANLASFTRLIQGNEDIDDKMINLMANFEIPQYLTRAELIQKVSNIGTNKLTKTENKLIKEMGLTQGMIDSLLFKLNQSDKNTDFIPKLSKLNPFQIKVLNLLNFAKWVNL
jgi:hypothetical protein